MVISPDGELLFSHMPWLDRRTVAVWDSIDLRPLRPRKPGALLTRQFNRVLGPAAPGYLWAIVRSGLFDGLPSLSVRKLTSDLPEVWRLPFALGEATVELPGEYLGSEERHFVGLYGGRWQTCIATPADSIVASYPCAWRGRNPRDARQPGFAGVFASPNGMELWYAVDRADHLIVVDARTLQDTGTLRLSRHGCRQVVFGANGKAYAQNFDTVVTLDAASHEVLNERRLQAAQWDENGRKFAAFIGELLLLPDGERLCVARPFSGDVVILDAKTLETLSAIPLGEEPLELALHPNGRELYVRDGWTGHFMRCPVD